MQCSNVRHIKSGCSLNFFFLVVVYYVGYSCWTPNRPSWINRAKWMKWRSSWWVQLLILSSTPSICVVSSPISTRRFVFVHFTLLITFFSIVSDHIVTLVVIANVIFAIVYTTGFLWLCFFLLFLLSSVILLDHVKVYICVLSRQWLNWFQKLALWLIGN